MRLRRSRTIAGDRARRVVDAAATTTAFDRSWYAPMKLERFADQVKPLGSFLLPSSHEASAPFRRPHPGQAHRAHPCHQRRQHRRTALGVLAARLAAEGHEVIIAQGAAEGHRADAGLHRTGVEATRLRRARRSYRMLRASSPFQWPLRRPSSFLLLCRVCSRTPDLVVSGPNNGYNLGHSFCIPARSARR